jgi:hypothetical protein
MYLQFMTTKRFELFVCLLAVFIYHAQKSVLTYLQSIFDEPNRSFPPDFPKLLKGYVESDPELKKDTKTLMQFGAFSRDEAVERGAEALATELAFDQRAILEVF